MAVSPGSDIIIRSRPALGNTQFIVLHGQSRQQIGGPFATLGEALVFASPCAAEAGGEVLYEALDERGRTTGTPIRLRLEPL